MKTARPFDRSAGSRLRVKNKRNRRAKGKVQKSDVQKSRVQVTSLNPPKEGETRLESKIC